MEEPVGFLPRNLEADKAFACDNGPVALNAEGSSPFHKSPTLRLAPVVGKRKHCLQGNSGDDHEFPLVHARDVEPAAKKWQWTGNPPSRVRRSPAKLRLA
jgi:hypothetical protein